jgi:hypothetical protein
MIEDEGGPVVVCDKVDEAVELDWEIGDWRRWTCRNIRKRKHAYRAWDSVSDCSSFLSRHAIVSNVAMAQLRRLNGPLSFRCRSPRLLFWAGVWAMRLQFFILELRSRATSCGMQAVSYSDTVIFQVQNDSKKLSV